MSSNEPIISKVYHNRCVLLDVDQMAKVGITKNSQVSVRVKGDAIILRKAAIVDTDDVDRAILDCLISFIHNLSPEQVAMLKQALGPSIGA